MEVIVCRSPVQIAEDKLIEASRLVFNLSRGDAQRLQIQRRELGADVRKQAEDLIENWDGSAAQLDQAHMISMRKRYAIARNI